MSHDTRDIFDAAEPLAGGKVEAPPAPARAQPGKPRRWWLNALLFVLTLVSATWAQSMSGTSHSSLAEILLSPLADAERLAGGLTFAMALMTILLAHEMGHYLVARRYGVDQTLPYFIPAPTFMGTLGAVIFMRSVPPDRGVLLRVALAGPLAGLALAVPAAIWGLLHSPAIDPSSIEPGGFWLGSSLLFAALERLFAPPGGFYSYHPLALAAWAGCLVTAINLMPAAQLDGGHIAYALLGSKQRSLSRLVVVLLCGLALWLDPRGPGFVWLVWAVLLALLGLRHPPVRNEWVPLTRRERVWAYVGLVLFALTFIPVPASEVTREQLGVSPTGEPIRREEPWPAPANAAPSSPESRDTGPAEEFRL